MAEGLTGRAAEMAASVLRTARGLGVEASGTDAMARCLGLTLGVRADRLADDHHPAALHPARTALILLRDAELRDPVLLPVGILAESRRPELAPAPEAVDDLGLPVKVRDGLRALPRPGDPGLAERLVTLTKGLRTVGLAEHLDQLRHLHMEAPDATLPPDADERWREARSVWGPLAERTHPALARRYRHWIRVFGRRLERM